MVKIWIKMKDLKWHWHCVYLSHIWLDLNDLRFKGKKQQQHSKKEGKREAEVEYSTFSYPKPIGHISTTLMKSFASVSKQAGKKCHFVHSYLWLHLNFKAKTPIGQLYSICLGFPAIIHRFHCVFFAINFFSICFWPRCIFSELYDFLGSILILNWLLFYTSCITFCLSVWHYCHITHNLILMFGDFKTLSNIWLSVSGVPQNSSNNNKSQFLAHFGWLMSWRLLHIDQ